MTQIVLYEGDRLDSALKKFRKMIERSGILRDVRQGRYYVKPSVARRLKRAQAQRRRRADARRAGRWQGRDG
jgi:small subunit ribosomal protein S21